MSDKCDDASATLDLPDLNFLISAAASQIVFYSALGCILLLSDDFAHIFGLFFGLAFCWLGSGPALIQVRFALIFQLLFHLLNALFRRQPRRSRLPSLILTCRWLRARAYR